MTASTIPSLAPCFVGALAPYAGLVRLAEEADAGTAPMRTLGEHGGACALVARYAAATYPEADRRAVVSLWTQWYFGILIVPTAAAILHLDRDLPVGLDEVGLAFRPDGRLETLILAHDGLAHDGTSRASIGAGRFTRLVTEHIDPLVRELARTFGVSRRLLWANAAVMLGWTLAQVEQTGSACCAALSECRALLDERTDACGRANPLCGVLCPVSRADGGGARRRVCCLRYRLPGMPSCGDLCPLTEAQRAGALRHDA